MLLVPIDEIMSDGSDAEAYVESEVSEFLNYFESTNKAKEDTRKNNKDAIHVAKKLVEKHRDCCSAYLTVGCEALAYANFEISEAIEASTFLSIHGMYRPANALLRFWLETALSALKFDYELKKCDEDTKTYEELLKERQKWLENPSHVPFGGKCGILSTLIDPDTDYVATKLIEGETSNSERLTFKQRINILFRDLSKFVHFRGMPPIEDLKPAFAEYNREYFEKWYTTLNQINEICTIITVIKFREMITHSDECKKSILTLENKRMEKKIKDMLEPDK